MLPGLIVVRGHCTGKINHINNRRDSVEQIKSLENIPTSLVGYTCRTKNYTILSIRRAALNIKHHFTRKMKQIYFVIHHLLKQIILQCKSTFFCRICSEHVAKIII